LERDGENDYFRGFARGRVFGTGNWQRAGGRARDSISFLAQSRRGIGGTLRIPRADDDRLSGLRPTQCQSRTFAPGVANDGDDHANSGSSIESAGEPAKGALI